MTYKSKNPTKEKRLLHNFMERNKQTGQVGINKFKKYGKNKQFTGKNLGIIKSNKKTLHHIYNKKGKKIASVQSNKKHITHWVID